MVKNMKVALCFEVAPSICSPEPVNAIIDTFNQISNHPTVFLNNHDSVFKPNMSRNGIPLALIIGISVCILSLLILLLLTVCYCIRRRNFKICKSLLTTGLSPNSLNVSDKDSNSPLSGFSSGTISETEKGQKSAHLNKTFNIDIGSISAPIGPGSGSNLTESSHTSSAVDLNNSAGYGTGGSGLNVINGSMSSSLNENLSQNEQLMKTSTRNMISNPEILVVEDSEQQHRAICQSKDHMSSRINKMSEQISLSKSSSSTGVSNCSSLNNNQVNVQNTTNNQLYTEFTTGPTYIETYNHNSSSSANSNSDPIAINNSLSSANSNSTPDNSPTYGYNVTNATTTTNPTLPQKNNQNNFDDNSDNLLYIRTGINHKNFHYNTTQSNHNNPNHRKSMNSVPISNSSSTSGASCVSKHNSFHGNHLQYNNNVDQATESGYSTPSRLKKVVYEVIV